MISWALAGWLAGAAINHAATILPLRQSVWQKPACLQCHTRRALPAWSALGAWLTRQPHCPHCGAPRERFTRSIITELVTPVFFGFIAWRYNFSVAMGLISLYTAILILITITDLEHRLIFNVVVLPATLFGFAASFFTPWLNWKTAAIGGVGAFVVIYVAALLSRGGLGEGDVTLSAFLGVILGFPHIILSLIFGVFLGGFVALILLVTGRVTLKTFIPYGPFLTITGWVMLIWGEEIWRYYFF